MLSLWLSNSDFGDLGYTSAGQIALESFSAGGVVAGAVINRHPNLLLAAILQVPFLDVLTILADETQPLTVHEYEEWGNPNHPEDFQRVRYFVFEQRDQTFL